MSSAGQTKGSNPFNIRKNLSEGNGLQQRNPYVNTQRKGLSGKGLDAGEMKPPKRRLPKPADPLTVITAVLMTLCKKVLYIDTSVKIGLYIGAVLFTSLFHDFHPFPPSYFSDPRNIFNMFIIRFGWVWTCLLLSSFIVTSSYIYTCGNSRRVVLSHLSRMLISSIIWYSCTSGFDKLQSYVGMCSDSSVASKRACRLAGKAWIAFDISGHTFLLMFNLLLISEEVKTLRIVEELRIDSNKEREDPPTDTCIRVKAITEALVPYVRLIAILMTLFTLFYEVMLLMTMMYFHTMLEKVVAAFTAVLLWFLLYQMWYRLNAWPCSPGYGTVRLSA